MLLEPVERETNTYLTSIPDIGVSVVGRPDVLSESSNGLEIPWFTQEMFPNGFNLDSFVNELTRINHTIRNLTKKHEEKQKSRLKSQWEGEVQSIKRKYYELNKEQCATLRKHKKFLQGLTGKVEGGQTVERELRAFEMAAESDIPLQDWHNLFSPQNSPTPSARVSEPAFMNCASFGRSTCMPPLQNTQAPPVETSQAPPTMTNQAPPVQINLAPPLTANIAPTVLSGLASTPISTSPALHILTNEARSISASLVPKRVSTSQMPRISSDQASTIPANLASACVSIVHGADVPDSLGPRISHIQNLPTQATPSLPLLDNQHLLKPDLMRMSPSTSWAPSVQKTRAPVVATAQVSPIQVPHFQADLAAHLWTSAARPTLRSQVAPVIAGMSHRISNNGASTIYPIHPPHLQRGRSASVLRNQAPPVHTASLLARPSGSQHTFSSPHTFSSSSMLPPPSPLIRLRRPHMSLSRPQAPQAQLSEFSYNVRNFGG